MKSSTKKAAILSDRSKQANSKQKSNKKSSPVLKFISKAMPYILTVLSVVLLFSLAGLLSQFGTSVKDVFNGLFSSFASYFIPLFMFYHALMWRYDVKRKICVRRVICSFVALFGMSTLQHAVMSISNEDLIKNKYIGYLYENGKIGHGGGVIGGLVSNTLTGICSNVVAIIIILVLLALMLLQMFNITPATMVKSLFSKKEKTTKSKKTIPNTPQKSKVKRKKVDIFDDEDDVDTQTISTFVVDDNTSNTKIQNDNKTDESKNSVATYVLDQLEPYDENKDYKALNDANSDSFIVSKTKLTSDEEEESQHVNQMPQETTEEREDTIFVNVAQINEQDISFDSQEQNRFQETNKEENNEDGKEDGKEASDNFYEADNGDYEEKLENFEDTQNEGDSANEDVNINEDENDDFSEENLNEEYDGEFDSESQDEYLEEAEDEFEEEVNEDENGNVDIAELVDTSEHEICKIDEITNDTTEKSENEDENASDGENSSTQEGASNTMPALSDKALEMIYGKTKSTNEDNDTSSSTQKKSEDEKVTNQEAPKKQAPHKFPPLNFLNSKSSDENAAAIREELEENASKIVTTLDNFGVKTKIVNYTRGPTVTRYEIAPEKGVRVKSISSLSDDIALNLAAEGIRIESPIPGKSAVGIEVPNKTTSIVYLKDLLATDKFKNAKGVLTCAVGKSISGDDVFLDIEKTPHLLVAGATGMGKSVCINSLIISMLYKASPEDLRLILVDPKRVELSNYNGIPHLLVPVVCEPKQSLGALQWAVTEMDKRFETIETAGVRNLTEFNAKIDRGYQAEKMSRIVIIIDELADLKMAVPDIEGHITRLTQKARAAGIHVIIGTQRPSVDVITGLIKNNIPSRIAFRVPSQTDSRTILDEQGADKLVSRGDMLVKSVDSLKPVRVQGAYVSAEEIESVINFLKENSEANYDEDVMQQIESNAAKASKAEKRDCDEESFDGEELDSEFYNALRLAAEDGKISSSQLQRRLRLGFQRAARIIDQMYDLGFIGEPNGQKPRDVLITLEQYNEMMMRRKDNN